MQPCRHSVIYSASTSATKLTLILLLKAFVLAAVILFYKIGLSPDEAQYWSWSQAIDWGYYSKPPGIAWQIWGTTALFGNSEFGVRFGALLIGFFLPLTVYDLARSAEQDERTSFWAAIVMAFCPLGFYLSLATTTDGGAILFLVLGIATVMRCNYPLAGVWIFLGALYKWTAFVLWPITLLFFLFVPKMRKWTILWGIAISLCALLPSIYWNLTHEWATFKHVGGAINHKRGGNFFDFLGAQIGLLGPVFLVLLLISFFKQKTTKLWFCAAFPLLIGVYLFAALFNKMQPNWAAYLLPAGMVLIAWSGYRRWMHIGVWLSIALVALGLLFPHIPFRQSLGWGKLAPALKQAGYQPGDVLMGDKYQAASILSFYGPEKKRAYFFNVSDTRKNQFTYWPQLEKGKTAFFVVIENKPLDTASWYETHYLKRLAPYFKEVSYQGAYPLTKTKMAMIFKCEEYSGERPQDPDVY